MRQLTERGGRGKTARSSVAVSDAECDNEDEDGRKKTPSKTPGDKNSGLHGRALICDLLQRMEKKLADKSVNPSVSDFIRLVQLEKEMAEEEPAAEIKVTWIDPRMGP